jgi:hypothetical protein
MKEYIPEGCPPDPPSPDEGSKGDRCAPILLKDSSSGEIRRTTLGTGKPDPRQKALADLLHWVWSCRLQLKRLLHSVEEETAVVGPYKDKCRQHFSQTSYDEHVAFVAFGDFKKALEQARPYFPSLSLSPEKLQALCLLRNLYEHWNQHRDTFRGSDLAKARSGKEFASLFPEGKPWSLTIQPSGDVLMADLVSLFAVDKEL